MKALVDIPFDLDAGGIIAQARVEAGSTDEADLRGLVDLARQVGRPKAGYAVAFVTEQNGDTVTVDGVPFHSRALARRIEGVERVFPLIATCGHELDRAFPAGGDMLMAFWWDLIKTRLLGAAHQRLNDHLHRAFRLGKTVTMRPGSGDASVWPVEQQKALFAVLGNVEEELGVRLTDSCLMLPNKTTSGLMFPAESDFRTCEVCHREACPSRQAPFSDKLWAELQHD